MPTLKRIIHEVHRRSLWQVLAIYVAGAWLGYEAIVALYEGLGLPEWVPPLAIVLFIIGLPVVLATAFVQEGGPAPARPEPTSGLEPFGHLDLVDEPGASESGGVAASAAPGVVGASGNTSSGVAVPPDPARGPLGVLQLLTWPRAILGGVLAFALLGMATSGYMGMRVLGIGPVGTLVAQGLLDERDPLVLADFQNSTPDSLLGEVVTEAVRIDLEQSPVLRVADAAAIAEALRRMARDDAETLDPQLAREVALREGYKAVLAGEVAAAGGAYLLTARLLAAGDGRVLASFRETAREQDELLDAMNRLSKSVREKVGESLRSVRAGESLEQVTTASLEALQKYTAALRTSALEGDLSRAVSLLEEAVAFDTAFASAHRKIGVYLSNLGLDRARQVEHLNKAYRHRDRLSARERYMVIAYYHQQVTGDVEQAVQAYRSLLDTWPDDYAALNNVGLLYSRMQDFAAAEDHYRRAKASEQGATAWRNLISVLYRQGKEEEARAEMRALLDRYPENVDIQDLPLAFAAAAGDYRAADSIAAELEPRVRGTVGPRIGLYLNRAHLAAVRGRRAEGERALEEVARIAESRGTGGLLLTTAMWRAGYYAATQDTEEGLGALEAALARHPLSSMDPLDRPYGPLAYGFALQGRPDRAEALLAEFESEVPAELRGDAAWALAVTRAMIASARGDHDEAVREIRAARRETGCAVCIDNHLGLIYDRAGQADSARAAYERFLEAPGLGRLSWDALHLPVALLRLGDLHEQAGDEAKAASYYARFVELWQDADPALQPRVRAIREHLGRLVDEGG